MFVATFAENFNEFSDFAESLKGELDHSILEPVGDEVLTRTQKIG